MESASATPTELSLRFNGSEGSAEATIGSPRMEPGSMPAVPHGAVLGYVPIETNLATTDLTSVSVWMRIDDSSLPEGQSPENVEVYRLEGDRWIPLRTTVTASGTYRADFSNLSSLAVASLAPGEVNLVNTAGPPDWAQRGTETTVTAIVENPGDRPANRTLTLTVDGTPVTNRTVQLGPGERRPVELTFPAQAGTVAVDGTEAGQLAVGEERQAGAQGGEPTMTSGDGPGFNPATAAIAVLVAALVSGVARRLRR